MRWLARRRGGCVGGGTVDPKFPLRHRSARPGGHLRGRPVAPSGRRIGVLGPRPPRIPHRSDDRPPQRVNKEFVGQPILAADGLRPAERCPVLDPFHLPSDKHIPRQLPIPVPPKLRTPLLQNTSPPPPAPLANSDSQIPIDPRQSVSMAQIRLGLGLQRQNPFVQLLVRSNCAAVRPSRRNDRPAPATRRHFRRPVRRSPRDNP